MMKKWLLTALVMGCLSVAHAVTFKWSGEELTNSTCTAEAYFKYPANSTHSVVASFTTPTSTGVMFAIGQRQNFEGSYNNSIYVEYANNGNVRLVANGNGTTKTIFLYTPGSEENQTHTVAYAFNRVANGSDSTIDIYFDGVKKASFTQSTWNGPSNAYWVSDTTTVDLTVYDGVLTEEEGIALTTLASESDPGVPEPTAFALLALGVAGLALRRRVA